MEIFIDQKEIMCDRNTATSVTLSVASLLDEDSARAGYTKSISIPATGRNCEIMGYPEQIHARDMFHSTAHTARIEKDGAVIIEGMLTLAGIRRNMDSACAYYDCNIIGSSKLWAEATSRRTISSLEDDFQITLSQQSIQNSWTDPDAWIRMLPVCRKRTDRDYSSGHLTPAAQILTCEDYHPFIHVATMLRKIMSAAGFRIVSQFMETEFFNSLYMSGRYPTADTDALDRTMAFLARRYSSGSAAADSLGRVYANPYAAVSTVGNLADSADATYEKDGTRYDDVYSRSGCFRIDGKRVMFKPLKEVSVGFEYSIHYTTSYRIASRTELAGFNRIYLGENFDRKFRLANNFEDRRQEFCAGKQFRIVIFDHIEGNTYRLYCSNSKVSLTVDDHIASRSKTVSIQYDGEVKNPTLYIKTGTSERVYTGDWALYDGYVTETGETDVKITLRTGAQTLSPSSPKYFDDIYFGGAESGMTLTLHKGTSIKPVFSPHPTEGSTLHLADVAAFRTSQKEFIAALRHMFSLCFYTDAATSTVYIEPATSFYETSAATDWTHKIDFSRPVTIQETGSQGKATTFRYKSGDAAVAAFNRRCQDDFGAWTMSASENPDQTAPHTSENPFFAPSIGSAGTCTDAPDARLIMAADSAEPESSLNFTPKIVRYRGMQPLPAGQRWGWPSGAAEYPLLTFHDGDEQTTLCFEDRDGAKGLNRFYARSIDALKNGKRLTLYLNLDATDMESLTRPGTGKIDFRSRFRLDIDGETGYYILEEICDYSPEAGKATKCRFIKTDF